jgi:hypothetical protein
VSSLCSAFAVLTRISLQEVNTCKGEWDNVKDALRKVSDVVHKFRRDDLAPLPDDVKGAFRELETCLLGVLEVVRGFEAVSPGELTLKRIGLKEKATSSVRRIDRACQVFQVWQLCICTAFLILLTHFVDEYPGRHTPRSGKISLDRLHTAGPHSVVTSQVGCSCMSYSKSILHRSREHPPTAIKNVLRTRGHPFQRERRRTCGFCP